MLRILTSTMLLILLLCRVTVAMPCQPDRISTSEAAADLLAVTASQQCAGRILGASPRPGRVTAVEFSLATTQDVILELVDTKGCLSLLATGKLREGRHELLVDGSKLADGSYLATLRTEQGSHTLKILVLR